MSRKRNQDSSCCTHAVIFFSSTIGVNWFRIPPSWRMKSWLLVFACVKRPSISINKQVCKTCSRPVIQWFNAEVWSTREDSLRPGKRIWEESIHLTIKYFCIKRLKTPLTTQRQTKRINQTILIMLRLYQSTVRHDGKTISTNYSPCMQLYKTLANWFFPLLSDVWSCSLLTYWFNFTNMLQHHFIAIKIELCWNLKRANARSLPNGF